MANNKQVAADDLLPFSAQKAVVEARVLSPRTCDFTSRPCYPLTGLQHSARPTRQNTHYLPRGLAEPAVFEISSLSARAIAEAKSVSQGLILCITHYFLQRPSRYLLHSSADDSSEHTRTPAFPTTLLLPGSVRSNAIKHDHSYISDLSVRLQYHTSF